MENSSEELQDQSEELCSRPSLSRAKKSWGFRRTTIAKREFLEQVGELAHSPPPVRKTRSRRGTQIPLTTPETEESQRHTPSAISVLDGLEWSAPSSPVAEETKPATETFNPSLWQDCGSAFHTAFSLLGGGESFQVEMPDALGVPDTAEAGDSIEPYDSCVEESAAPKNDFPDGNHDGEMLLGEIGEMLMQKDEQESRCTSIREVKGRKGRGRICATDESAMPNNEDSPGGEMLLREFGEMLTRKVGKDQRYTTIRGVRSRKGRGTICAADESTVASNEDSPDAITHSVLGDLGVDSDLVLIPPQEGGCSDCEMLLSETAEMLTQKSGQGDRGTAVKVGKGRGRQCTTEESAVSSREDSPDITHSGLGDEREDSDVVLISPQEEADSDGENTVMETGKLLAPEVGQEQRDATARGAKGGKARGRKRGRGRGRRKAKGRGKGRGKPGGLQANAVGDELVIVSPTEPEQQVEKLHGTDSPIEISTSPAHSVSSLSPAQRSNSDYICIESDVDQVINETHDQSDDAPKQRDKEVDTNGETPPLSDHDGYDPDAVTCICRQQGNDRSMVRCVSCQEWFHGSCVGISGTEGCKGYVCPTCVTKNQSEHQPDCCPQPEDDCCLPKGLTLSRQDEDMAVKREQQAVEDPQMVEEEEERTEAPVINIEPEPQAVMKKDGTLPLCIGPGCPREALPESVYCGTDCILQHAAATMKTLCVPKEPKTRGALQKKPATTTASAKGQRSCGTSKSLGANAEDEDKEKDGDGGQKEAAPPSPCDPPPTGVQATSLPSSKLYTASKMDKTQDFEAPLKQSAEDSAAHGAPSSQPASEAETPQGHSPETPQEPNNGSVPAATRPCPPPNAEQVTVSEAPSTSAPSRHQTEALTVRKKAFIIPKKPPAPQPSSSPVLPSTSGQKPSAAPALVNETRNLLVPPAPSAPSSRPSQPNNQIRQSIQKSLVSILVKRVGECGDLKTSESDVVKLVASIEVEMFDIFRNTDSKYMNKYRTIMFNLKDPRNKGLLYGFVRGEISPFRLVRMTQKDMQAIKASDTTEKQTSEAKDSAATAPPVAKVTSVLPKPEAVKVDLPILNPTRPHRSTEQKKSLPPPAAKSRTMQPIQTSALPDILTCMLKDTTSEHKTHIFDLKCKICTGQISSTDDEEPSKKKPRVSETRDRNYPSWRKSTEDDSALPAPPQSPDLDSPPLFIMETSSHLTSDSPVLTIVESPASPTMDSPASPVLESPASPVMDSPASPTPDPPKAFTSKSALMPVVNPAVSMTTMTRRDPRTAANRFSVLPNNQSAPYAPPKETRSVPQMAPGSLPPPPPPSKVVPKSILKPLSADPRFYSALSRSVSSGSPSVDETSQFLAKQEILWKGFINMLTVAKFVSKAYLVSGPAENLKADLPDTIQIGGRILPETVWDYVDKVKSSITKELCVIRFHPATEEEEVAYVSLFSYFSSRRRFGVVASGNRSIKDLYLVPVGANESVPSMLQPLEGPGLETKRPNLLLGLAIIQRTKRSGIFSQETEEKRPKVHLAKDPMWIPKPPVLYGSDRLDVFQPYDPETPANSAVPSSPLRPGSPPAPSSSLTKPSSFISVRPNLSVALSVTAPAAQSPSTSVSDKPPVTPSGDKTPLQTILSSLFGSNPTESTASTNESSTNISSVKKPPALSQVAATMVDPIVQQYGQKSKIKEIEEENDFDRPYDPEEEYDPAVGYGIPTLKNLEKTPAAGPAVSSCVEDDVAYDPEDDTIFADVSSIAAKRPVQTQMSDPSSCDPPVSTQPATPVPTSTASSDGITPNLPSGTVVVSAATLNEQQRMLEELNKQIEEQKRQLKEQEEALRQQREAVGMFMAQFSASDSMMPPPTKTLPLSQMPSLKAQADTKPSEMTDKTVERSPEITANAEKQTVEPQDTSVLKEHTDTPIAEDETNTEVKDGETYSSAGEIEDSDVAYDPEDESFFKEVEDGPFEGNGGKTYDRSLSRRSRSTSHKGSQNSSHSRKRRLSPKRRGHRERDHHRSPSRKRRSSSHSQKRRERDRHRRSDGERSRHRGRGHSERQGRHRKEHNVHRQSLGRRSSSCLSQQDHVSFSPEHQRQASSELELSFTMVPVKNEPDEQMIRSNLGENPDESCTTFSHDLLQKVKVEISDQPASDELLPNPFSNHHDPAQGTSVQANTLIKQQSQIESKIESMIPLREIDPPIRDSPESPDPEPQFAKPSSIEKRDTANAEKMQNASIRFSGPVSRVPGMPSMSSSKSCPDLPFQNNHGKGMTEGRNTELMKGSEKSLNCESSFMRGMSPEVKGLLGLKREANTPEPGKTHDRPGVNIPQCKNVAEANVLGSGTKNSPDFNISMASGTTVPREDLIFQTDRRIEQTGQEVKPSIPNITSPDWRGPDLPAAGMRNQRCPNTGFGPHVIDPHCSVEGSDMQGHWRGPNRRGPCVVRGRGGPFVQDARKYQPKWRGPSIDDPRQTGQDFMTSGPVIEAPMHERRDPGNPHSRRTDPERGGPNDSQGCGIRGPQGAPFERITPLGEGPVSNGRGQAGPDFGESWLDTEPWFDQRNLPIKGAEAGPGNPQFLGQDHISPEYRGLEPPGYPIDHPGAGKGGLQGPDFRGPEQHLNHPHSAMRGPGCPEVKGPGLDRRSIGGPPQSDRRGPDKRFPFIGNLRPDRMGPGPGHPDFRETEADWRSPPIEASGYMRTSLGGPMGALEPGRIGPPHSESWRPESDISDSNVACPGSERRTSGGQNLIGQESEYPGAWTSGPGPDFMEMQPETPGPGHHTRRRGREPFRVSDPGSEYQNMEGPESADFRGPGLERRPPVMDQPHNCRGFPDIPRFSLSMPQRSPAMEGCESDRRGSHFGRVKPERPALEGPTHIRRGFRGPEPNRQPCDNRGADIRGREPNRQEQEAPGLRELGDEFELGIRQKDPVPESHRHRRDNWHETEFMGSEPIQGGPDIGSPGSRGPSHIFRGPRRTNAGGPRSETERWKEQNFRDSSLERRGRDLEEQWPNRRVPGLEEHERNLSDGDWKHHRDRSPRFTHESADEQFQHGQEPMEWRGPENRGQKMLLDRPTVQGRGPRGDVTGPDFRSPGLDRDHPGSTREGSSNEMMNQERDQPDRWSSGIAFRGSRVPDNRRKSHDRRIPIMRGPGPDMRVGQDMENDFRPTEFRDKIRGSNMEERQTLNRGPGFETPPLNRRADMDDLERRVPRGPESERAGSESRLFTFEGPEASRRFSDGGRMRSERQGDNMERPTSIREGSEDFRRVNRGPNMRRLGPEQTSVRDLAPDTSGVRHGPGRWDTLTESSRSESRRGKPALRRFNSPSEVPRFQGPIGPPCPGFDQQQQGTQPQGRKAALLPTPTGPICFPNLAVKNPGSFGPEGKHAGCSTPRGRGRGRSLSRDR